MRIPKFLLLIAALLFIIGVLVGYLLLSIPQDVQAETLLREARAELARPEPNREEARRRLLRIVRDYPRTDAAAAATFALFEMQDTMRGEARIVREELRQAERELQQLRAERKQLAERIEALEARVEKAEQTASAAQKTARAAQTAAQRATRRRR